jgi:hypothetical protein
MEEEIEKGSIFRKGVKKSMFLRFNSQRKTREEKVEKGH